MKLESRKLIKFGNYSLCITLPKKTVTDLKLKKGDSVDLLVEKDKNRIIINLKKGLSNAKVTNEAGHSNATRW